MTEQITRDAQPDAAPDELSARDCPTCDDDAEDCMFNRLTPHEARARALQLSRETDERLAEERKHDCGDAAPDNAWRPIETAPKDGTWILLYPRDGNGVICTGSWATWRDGDSGWAAGGGWFEPDDVSHWVPLPDPPK